MAGKINVRSDVPLAPMTTFGVGGKAAQFVEARSEEEIREALRFADENGLEVFILGGGSNVLVSDAGFDGLVIRIALKGVSTMELPGGPSTGAVVVTAMAGEDWDHFVAWCVGNDLAGIECLSGIPGLVGGTPIQNVGAYGQEVSETIVSVRAIDRKDGSTVDISREECGFEYRRSIFNTVEKGRYIVISVTYVLEKGGKAKIAYKDLADAVGEDASLSEVREAVRKIRASKGMLVRQGGADSRSAGSFFKNPVVNTDFYKEVREKALREGDQVPHFSAGEGRVKIPAAWLIEHSGFSKGFTLGNAGISTVHALALTNRGEASASEVIALKNRIAEAVLAKWGIELEPEPNLIGF